MTATPNIFANAPLERASHLRKDQDWLIQASRCESARFVPVFQGKILLSREPRPSWVLLNVGQMAALNLGSDTSLFLGLAGPTPFFAFTVPGESQQRLLALGEFVSLRTVGTVLSADQAAVLAYARAMVLWQQEHRFCNRCGSAVSTQQGGHVLACSDETCGKMLFPRLDPAIIVLVGQGDRCLLGRQASWPPGRYSTIAGFVEPGESIEDAVAREVFEETGVRTADARYHSSQPWPFPSSLMLGFHAQALSSEIALIDGELEEARWFDRRELVSGELLLPPAVSISYRLIQSWYDSRPGHLLARDAGPARDW